ncbi:hypothetical protein HMPREF9080_01340 [Cardiobacterium valvarum F0432]|uniref:Uncharacterized protein n=1 Tax=Cardiobacterium valvarum F0432 TaxID=797473 RepID=G9ZF00_9GAMM|nr:hypothetical protein HMPREF9080_01340 [Cardiobacterium valvarum F0432]
MDGGLRQVVRFVNHKCLNIRQDFRKSLAFQGKIGQQQVMVDDHHIRFLRLLSRLLQIAFLVKRAVAAKAVLNCRGNARQYRRVFRHFFQADQIAVGRRVKKMLDGAALPLVRRRRAVIIKIPVIVMVAEVIAPPFQQRNAGHAAQHFAHQRQILAVNLFLQITRSGGHQPLAAGGQKRQQIGKCLARTGTRFSQQNAVARQIAGDGFGQFLLPLTRLITADGAAQGAACRKQGGNIAQISKKRLW